LSHTYPLLPRLPNFSLTLPLENVFFVGEFRPPTFFVLSPIVTQFSPLALKLSLFRKPRAIGFPKTVVNQPTNLNCSKSAHEVLFIASH